MPMALFSPPLPPTFSSSCAKTQVPQRPLLALVPRRRLSLFVVRSADNGTGAASSAVVEKSETKEGAPVPVAVEEEGKGKKKSEGLGSNNGASVKLAAAAAAVVEVPKFKDPRWVEGTWDLKQFKKDGSTDWDAVIDAEARRRKWLEENPEASSSDDPVVFDTSIIPWWAWIKRFHLPEAERLNGRAAMIGFFMAYFVDSLTGVGLVDQMGNFFCKSLLFISVAGVLLIRKNEDIETLKKLIKETTFYDKQWQATWQDKNASETSKE